MKSSNVLLTKDNVAKVADVGLAKMEGYLESSSGDAAGTFDYAAPELLLAASCTSKVHAEPTPPELGPCQRFAK